MLLVGYVTRLFLFTRERERGNKMYKRWFHQMIEPVVNLNYLDVREVAKRLQGSEGDSDNISNACGEVLLKISGLMELVDFVFNELDEH